MPLVSISISKTALALYFITEMTVTTRFLSLIIRSVQQMSRIYEKTLIWGSYALLDASCAYRLNVPVNCIFAGEVGASHGV